MPVKCDEYNGVCVLAIDGDFCADMGAHVKRLAEQRIKDRKVVDFVLDLEKSSFLDSRGLEALLWLKRRCDEVFGRVKLTGLDENCRKILEITRLSHRFECHSDLPSALKTMR
jgi:anti-anti-sigma factor